MRLFSCRILFVALLILQPTGVVLGRHKTIFVSPTGCDNNTGTRRAPLATINAAINKIESYRKDNTERQYDVYVRVLKGTYTITEPIVFSSDKCAGNSYNMKIIGDGKGKTVISGGTELPPFKVYNDSIWYTIITDSALIDRSLFQLFVNDRRAILARTPNQDKYFVPIKAIEYEMGGGVRQELQLSLKNLDVINSIDNTDGIYVTILHFWDMTRKPVLAVNKNECSIDISGYSVKMWDFFKKKGTTQFYFENDISFLDAPGEFFFDSISNYLFYYPLFDETIQDTKTVLPITECIFRFEGTEEQMLKNISIEGITITNTSYNVPVDGENPEQAVASKSAVIMLDYSSNISFYDCEISHTGENGIWFRKSCFNSKIEHCYFHDLGAGGIKIGENTKKGYLIDSLLLTRNICVNNNIIREGGRILPPAPGIILFNASDCKITHNEVSDLYYSGISVGWCWGVGDSPSKRNIISYNHIHHLGWGALSDLGGIYTLGKSEGTIISNNRVHHIYSYGSDGYGIYADEGTSDLIITNNIVYKCKSAGFAQHYGRNNYIVNNIFADNIQAQLSIGRSEQINNSLVFRKNIISTHTSAQVFSNENWGFCDELISDQNLYWSDITTDLFWGYDRNTWSQITGKDNNSCVLNPQIVVDHNDDLFVMNKKALKSINYSPIKNNMGVYGNNGWCRLAHMNNERIKLFVDIMNMFDSDDK